MTTCVYIWTSRQRIEGTAGSAPEAQAYQLRQDCVPEVNVYRDAGISGDTGTTSRAGWWSLDAKLVEESSPHPTGSAPAPRRRGSVHEHPGREERLPSQKSQTAKRSALLELKDITFDCQGR